MPSFSSNKVHPMYIKPEERFPYTRYRSMGLIQIILGIILLALGTYDLVLHFNPQWYSTKCDFWRAEPCKYMKGDTYFWSPKKGLTWTLVATPIYAGLTLIISGFVGTCTCDTDCTSQRCLCHAFMSLSLLISVIFAPACVIVSFLQGVYAIENNLHTLRTIMPLCSGGVGIIAVVVCFVTMCLCCCFTDYDPEIPLDMYEGSDTESTRPSAVMASAPPIRSHPSSQGSLYRDLSPPQHPLSRGTCSPDMLKAYIRHLSDVSNMMAEMLVQSQQAPHLASAGISPMSYPLGFPPAMTGGFHGGGGGLPLPTPRGVDGRERHQKHRNYRRKTGGSTRRNAPRGSSSSQTLPTVTTSSNEEEFDADLPGQASASKLELLESDAERHTRPRKTTSVV